MFNYNSSGKFLMSGWFCLLLLIFTSGSTLADDFHYRNHLIGERAAGLGGAYTAVSDSPSGNFHNPAGIVYVPGSSLSASVNAFNYSSKTYKDTLTQIDGRKVDYEQISSVLLPNFFGMVSNWGNAKVGLSYAVPNAVQRKQKQSFSNLISALPGVTIDRYTININDNDDSYLFGPSLAFKLGERMSLGATLYGHYRDSTMIRNQLVELSTGEFEWTNQYQDRTDWGVQPKLGLMAELFNKVTFGLTVSRLWILSSEMREQTTYRGISSGGFSDPDLVSFGLTETDGKPEYPWVTTLGMAWFPTPALMFSSEASYYTKVSGTTAKEATFNLSIGAEYYMNDNLAMRCGLFTDLANTPELQSNQINQKEHIDLYGGSLSLTRFNKSSSTTLGIGYMVGSGDAQIIANSSKIQDVDMNNLSVFLSAAYSF